MIRIIITGLALAALSLGSLASANEAVVRNINAPQLRLYYKIVHQDSQGHLIDSKVQKIQLATGMVVSIPLTLGDASYVGIVPVRVNDRVLPAYNTSFNQSGKCSVATDAQSDKGTLNFGYQEQSDAFYCQPAQQV